jgi:ABC-type Na+ transport system ATPase subunit NatA
MHRGHILAEGTAEQLLNEHEREDVEELFIHLTAEHDRRAVPVGAAAQS